MPKLTTAEFVSRAKQIHGNKIDFSLVEYKNSSAKVKLRCNVCGHEWATKASHVLSGHGCPKCAIRKQAERRRKTKEEFVRKAQEVHGKDRYDYSLVEYKKNFIKVKIICLKCSMCFKQTPNDHLQGCGCPYCARNRKLTTDQFIKKAQRIHRDKIDFSKVKYVNSQTKVLLRCNVCGYEWWAIPNNVLRGHGCPKCAGCKRLTKEEFVERARKIHKDKNGNPLYDYSLVEYKNNRTKVAIKCLRCNNIFLQVPDAHLRGQGCPYCRPYGSFDRNLPAILYYIKVKHNGEVYYKIGITNNSVEERFKDELDKIEVLKTWWFEKGLDAYHKEQEILKTHDRFRYKGTKRILYNGNSELFTQDVLGLDTS